MKNREAGEIVNIGRIGSSVGLRGEVRVNLYASDSDNLKEGKVLLLKHAGEAAARGKEVRAACASVRLQNGRPVIRIEGFNDRDAADSLRGMELYIYASDLEELQEGEHYVRDLLGYRVTDLASGRDVGVLQDVIQNTAQDIFDVRTPEGKSVLIPVVDAFLRRIDDENEVIEVELSPGFID